MKALSFCVLVSAIVALEVFSQEKTNLETGPMQIEFIRSGGYEGTPHGANINSEDLTLEEASKLRELVNAASFFDLPPKISSKQRLCFDCWHYTISIETSRRKHTVYIDTETAEVPLSLRPLLSWLSEQACNKPEFKRNC